MKFDILDSVKYKLCFMGFILIRVKLPLTSYLTKKLFSHDFYRFSSSFVYHHLNH